MDQYNEDGLPRPPPAQPSSHLQAECQQKVAGLGIRLGRFVASGMQSIVWHGLLRLPPSAGPLNTEGEELQVAVKFVTLPTTAQHLEHFPTLFNREVLIMAFIADLERRFLGMEGASCVLPLVAYDVSHFVIVSPYMPNDTLASLILLPHIPHKVLLACALRVAYAMTLMHSYNILHRDLRPQNIFIDGKYRAFVADFGLSKQKLTDDTSYFRGVNRYRAPELNYPESRSSPACDVFSFGLILFEVICRREAYLGYDTGQQHQLKLSSILPDFVATGPVELERLIRESVQANPSDRPASIDVYFRLARFYRSIYGWDLPFVGLPPLEMQEIQFKQLLAERERSQTPDAQRPKSGAALPDPHASPSSCSIQ